VSEWGLAVMTLLVLTADTVVLRKLHYGRAACVMSKPTLIVVLVSGTLASTTVAILERIQRFGVPPPLVQRG
jgi:hypothetical protein